MSSAICSILAVVGDPALRRLIEDVDLGPGMVLHAVAEPAEAERLHARLAAEVVIAAAALPGGGVECLARARRRDADCFRVLVDAPTDSEVLVRGLNLGMIDAILPLPINLDALRALLHQGCEAALLRRHNRSLLAELGTRNQELLELNARLEDTVVSRTAQLQRALDDLSAANGELRAKQAELVRMETQGSLAQLVRGLAHELNNPLAVVLGYAQRLRRAVTDPDLERRIAVIIQEAGRMTELVERLRGFTQPIDEERLACEPVAALAAAVAAVTQESGGPLRLASAAPLPPVVAAPRALQRVLAAVVRNAREAGARTLAIAGESAFGRVRLAIANDGETPTEDQCRNALRPFFTTRAGSGHQGLGLALASGLLSEMEGSIELRPLASGGAEVVIQLPEARAGGEIAVLVVEDEPMLRELMCESLADEGWTATPAGTLAEADALVASQPFAAVVVDRQLPDGDGCAWAGALAARHEYAGRLLLISGEPLDSRGLPVLLKPFSLDDLKERVRHLSDLEPAAT